MSNLNRTPLIAALAALSLGLAACGGDDEEDAQPAATTPGEQAETGGGEGEGGGDDKRENNNPVVEEDKGSESIGTVKVTETDFAIQRSEQALLAEGVWTFEVKNEGGVTHALEIDGPNGESETGNIAPGETKTVDAYLVSGKYRLYCPIGDHAARGMSVELPVNG